MSDYCFNDYDKFIGKYITVLYDCDSKCRRLHCKLLRYYKKSPKEELVILKAHNNMIYHINCDKIVYWTAEYKDMDTENQDAYEPSDKASEPAEVVESEDLLLEKAPDKEIMQLPNVPDVQFHDVTPPQETKIIYSYSANLPKDNICLPENEAITYDELQDNVILPESEERKDNYNKNVLKSPLASFINSNFQGVYLTIYTTSTQVISGEVIFNYDYLIVLKSDEKTYYINPDQITYFC